jgi:raffinose/stachyose/melibiose transport system substrate-binding protein
MPFTSSSPDPNMSRRSPRAFGLAAVVAAALMTATSPLAHAEGVTLKVFGGSSLDKLAPRQKPDDQARIEKEVIDGFLEAYPDVEAVEWDAQGPQGDGVQRLVTAMLAQQEIDLISCSAYHTNGTYIRRGLLKPITGMTDAFADRVEPSAFNAYEQNGELYGVPISTMSTSTIYYNKDMFAELGIDVPETYEDVVAAAPKFAEMGVIPMIHQGANAPLWPMWYFETFSQASGDPIEATSANLAGEGKFNDEAGVEAFALIKKWVDDGILSPESLSVDQAGMRAAFVNGKAAMYYGGTWEIPALRDQVSDFEWGVFPFPKMAGTPGDPGHGGGPDNGICISSSIAPEKMDAALGFIEYLTRPEVATLYLAPEEPLGTSIKGVAGVQADYAEVLREKNFPATIKFLDWIWPSEVTRAVASSIAGVVGGEVTPQEAADTVQQAYDDLVDQGQWPPK